VGKALALAEIRLTLASVVMSFDFSPAPGMTREKFHEAQRDMLTMNYGEVGLVFHERA